MQRIESQPMYILHRRPYRETSLLLEVFSQDHGRFSLIAKGIRKPKSAARGLLQPFVPLLISCCGKGELLTLTQVESLGRWPFLTGRRLASAFYLNELLNRLLYRFDVNTELFLRYDEALNGLANLAIPADGQSVLRLFEKHLLKALGYELQLAVEVGTGERVRSDALYFFDPSAGPSLALSSGSDAPPGEVKATFKGESLLALEAGVLQEMAILSEVKRLMRQALAPHLGNKPLESRKLL